MREIRDWFLSRCRPQGTHLMYQGTDHVIWWRPTAGLYRPAPTRLRWFLEHGEDPAEKSLWVLHIPECEKELGDEHWRCVALDHLYLGTLRDKTRDRRITFGDRHTICRLHATGKYRIEELAHFFGLHPAHIPEIILRRRSLKTLRKRRITAKEAL